MDLKKNELNLLLAIIDTSQAINDEEQFVTRLYPLIRQLFPHQMFACGIGATNDQYVHRLFNISFPPEYIAQIMLPEGYIISPLVHRWAQQMRPQYLDIEQIEQNSSCNNRWREAVKQCGIQNLVGHGVTDVYAAIASYFSFANIKGEWDSRKAFIVNLVVPHLHNALVQMVASHYKSQTAPHLSSREREVLKWLCIGKSNEEIAIVLDLSIWTVKTHVKNVIRKLQVSGRSHAAAKAVSMGIIQTPG